VRRRLLLVRHGVTDWNRQGRFQGYLDPPLSSDGLHQARLLAERIATSPDERPARIVTSPLVRSLHTAEAIATALDGTDVEVEADRRLMELGQGQWEGRTHAELEVNDADRYAAWRRASPRRPPPGGESLEEATQRVGAFLDEALAETDQRAWPLCVVAHGGSLRIGARRLLGIGLETAWDVELDNASLSVLEMDGPGWRLVTWNDVTHRLGRVAVHVDEEDGEPLAL
jgi:broad specificity phosphatase PhoE